MMSLALELPIKAEHNDDVPSSAGSEQENEGNRLHLSSSMFNQALLQSTYCQPAHRKRSRKRLFSSVHNAKLSMRPFITPGKVTAAQTFVTLQELHKEQQIAYTQLMEEYTRARQDLVEQESWLRSELQAKRIAVDDPTMDVRAAFNFPAKSKRRKRRPCLSTQPPLNGTSQLPQPPEHNLALETTLPRNRSHPEDAFYGSSDQEAPRAIGTNSTELGESPAVVNLLNININISVSSREGPSRDDDEQAGERDLPWTGPRRDLDWTSNQPEYPAVPYVPQAFAQVFEN
jgi:hypothetical protein